MNKIKTFLQEFQDYYVNREADINPFQVTELTGVEIKLITKYLDRLRADMEALNTLSTEAIEETEKYYNDLLNVLEEKLDYISDVADVYNDINSYFDMRTVRDMKNFNLRLGTKSSTLFDPKHKGLTLSSKSASHNCSKKRDGSVVSFFNTNGAGHSGIHLKSKYLPFLTIKQIIIRKVDGTTQDVSLVSSEEEDHYIYHDPLVSSRIDIEFTNEVSSLPSDLFHNYIETMELSLLEYDYNTNGEVRLEVAELDGTSLFTMINSIEVPYKTYVNMNLVLQLIDQYTVVDEVVVNLPVNNTVVCKRLDTVDFNEVGTMVDLIIKGEKTPAKKLTVGYIKGLSFPNEKYLLYIPKNHLEHKLNKYISKLGLNSFRVNESVVKKIRVFPTLELYSFDKNSTPIVRYLMGVTKNETI